MIITRLIKNWLAASFIINFSLHFNQFNYGVNLELRVNFQILRAASLGGGLFSLLPALPPVFYLEIALFLILGASSTKSVSRGRLSGNKKYRMLFPLIVSWSIDYASRPLTVILTALRWVFMETSTPVTVPVMMVPFLSSTTTVSLLSFIKNRTSFIGLF